MRLFIAIHFNDNTRFQLIRLCDELRVCSKRGNISLSENLHLTLTFLGECDTKQMTAAKDVMDSMAFQPFEITFNHIGRFKRDNGDIWWVGAQENKPLLDLQRNLSKKLITSGFALENRKYQPHITLGREVISDTQPWKIDSFCETVRAIDLMKSERIHGKLTYTPIYTKKAIKAELSGEFEV